MTIPLFESFIRVWFLTWTSYGTWLPGDDRGFVSPKFEATTTAPRSNVVGTPYDAGQPDLRKMARENLIGAPILLHLDHALKLKDQFEATARYRGWVIAVGAIMATHLHLVVGVNGDPEPADLMRDFKGYGSRTLNRAFTRPRSGTWWTEQGTKRKVKNQRHYVAVVRCDLHQQHPLIAWSFGGVDVLRSGG